MDIIIDKLHRKWPPVRVSSDNGQMHMIFLYYAQKVLREFLAIKLEPPEDYVSGDWWEGRDSITTLISREMST